MLPPAVLWRRRRVNGTVVCHAREVCGGPSPNRARVTGFELRLERNGAPVLVEEHQDITALVDRSEELRQRLERLGWPVVDERIRE
jgi:hypothetical protein